MIRKSALPALLLCLGVAIATPALTDTSQANQDLQDLVALIPGEFDNQQQITALQAADVPAAEREKYSRLHHHRIRINSPGLPGFWIFAQINQGEPPVETYRQTVSEFFIDDSGEIRSRVWAFRDPGVKERGLPQREFLDTLTREQLLIKLDDGCASRWRRRGGQFEGRIDHRQCVIDSRHKGEKRQLFAEEIIFDDGMWAREGAYRMDGSLAFGLVENQFFRYRRLVSGRQP